MLISRYQTKGGKYGITVTYDRKYGYFDYRITTNGNLTAGGGEPSLLGLWTGFGRDISFSKTLDKINYRLVEGLDLERDFEDVERDFEDVERDFESLKNS